MVRVAKLCLELGFHARVRCSTEQFPRDTKCAVD